MSEWNPDLYLRFKQERTQPTRDLINRIRKDHAGSIIDIGCGPGNSTIELKRRWRDARIIGLDNSEAMLEKARADYPELEWINRDAGGDLSDLGTLTSTSTTTCCALCQKTSSFGRRTTTT